MGSRPKRKGGRHRTAPDPLAKTVGARIRTLRKARDWTFDAWVEELGLGRGYVSELERGLVVPSLTTLARVAGALELTIADLVIGDTPREVLFDVCAGLDRREVARLLDLASRAAADHPPRTGAERGPPRR
jgi:transcriptional regulator with XRE-family HTH domain